MVKYATFEWFTEILSSSPFTSCTKYLRFISIILYGFLCTKLSEVVYDYQFVHNMCDLNCKKMVSRNVVCEFCGAENRVRTL